MGRTSRISRHNRAETQTKPFARPKLDAKLTTQMKQERNESFLLSLVNYRPRQRSLLACNRFQVYLNLFITFHRPSVQANEILIWRRLRLRSSLKATVESSSKATTNRANVIDNSIAIFQAGPVTF